MRARLRHPFGNSLDDHAKRQCRSHPSGSDHASSSPRDPSLQSIDPDLEWRDVNYLFGAVTPGGLGSEAPPSHLGVEGGKYSTPTLARSAAALSAACSRVLPRRLGRAVGTHHREVDRGRHDEIMSAYPPRWLYAGRPLSRVYTPNTLTSMIRSIIFGSPPVSGN